MNCFISDSTQDRLTQADRKLIKSLEKAKNRRKEGLFLVEGPKAISECLRRIPCVLMVGCDLGFKDLQEHCRSFFRETSQRPKIKKIVRLASDYDFASLSRLQTPRTILALFKIPQTETLAFPLPGLTLLLDNLQDPGNVGTILRTADWFGLSSVIVSSDCADPFSPKAVQASMGSIAHVKVLSYCREQITERLQSCAEKEIPIIGSFLQGESLFSVKRLPKLQESAILVLGNEGNGISPEIARHCNFRITIPSLSNASHGDSLNVATALSVFLTVIHLRE